MTEEKMFELNDILDDFVSRLNEIIEISEDKDMNDILITMIDEKTNDLILELNRALEMSEFLETIGK